MQMEWLSKKSPLFRYTCYTFSHFCNTVCG